MFLEKWVSLFGYIFIWMSELKRRGIFIKRFGVWCKMSRRFDLNTEAFVCLNINVSLCIFILFSLLGFWKTSSSGNFMVNRLIINKYEVLKIKSFYTLKNCTFCTFEVLYF